METELSKILGITFTEPFLLQIALTHRSYGREFHKDTPKNASNERLEFLGDAVLTFLTASWLYKQFPDHSEGELSTLRADLVRMTTLARFARDVKLGNYVRISRSEEARAARTRDALLADAFEAVVGAIYLDQGIDAALLFVEPFLERETQRVLAGDAEIDYRTQIQKFLQSKYSITPTYRTVDMTGPAHCRQFTVEVLKGDECLGVGHGSSKQAAAQDAARVALEKLQPFCKP